MNRPHLIVLTALILLSVTSSVLAQRSERIQYLADSIAEKNDDYIRLLGGSVWSVSRPSIALVASDIIIVFRSIKLSAGKSASMAIAYVDGDEFPVTYARGPLTPQNGVLTSVIETLRGGAVLRLADGSLLSVPKYDQFDTGFWLPPYEALLTENGLYLYNLKKGKKVWVEAIKKG